MAKDDFSWAIPVMRAGYAGRALVYLVVAGVSLAAISHGGQASGTSEALAQIEQSAWGIVALALICLGMACYGLWRLIDSLYDLEDYGSDAKGIVARVGMIATGVIHVGLGILALTLIIGVQAGSGDGSAIANGVGRVMSWPAGRWIVGVAGLITIGAGVYYLHKGWTHGYRKHLRASDTIRKIDPVLAAGVMAQGVIVLAVGALLAWAAITADPSQAGGIAKVFSWLYSQPLGYALVTVICVGLLGFSLFCAVNAIWRVVPKAEGPDVMTLAKRIGAEADRASRAV